MIDDLRATDVLVWEAEQESFFEQEEESVWRSWKRNTYPSILKSLEEDVGAESIAASKKEYLEGKIAEEAAYLQKANERVRYHERIETPFWLVEAIMDALWERETHEKAYKSYKSRLHFLEKGDKSKLTDEMVAAARSYPIEDILDFDARGFTECPYHEEKTPSFSLWRKKNIGHCFGCGSSADGIKLLMDIEKLTFVDAVKKLASY